VGGRNGLVDGTTSGEPSRPTLSRLDPLTALSLFALAFVVGGYGTIIGAGGGFLLVPGLALLFGLDGANAVGTGAITLALIRIAGAVAYDAQGLVVRPLAAWFALGSAPVALLAGWLLTNRFESAVLLTAIGVLLMGLAVFVLLSPTMTVETVPTGERLQSGQAHHREPQPRVGVLVGGGAGVGILAGLFAVGGGLVTVPFLARTHRLTAHQAVASTAAAGTVASSAASVGHALAGNIVWSHTPFLVVGAIVGSTLGANFAGRLPARTVMALLALGLLAAGLPLIGVAQWR